MPSEKKGLAATLAKATTAKKSGSLARKLSLTLPPAKARFELQPLKTGVKRSSPKAAVAIAAAAEYVLAELLEMSSDVASQNNRTRVTLDDLSTAMRDDVELSRCLGDCALAGDATLSKKHGKEYGRLFK
jgi:histone H3/H4